MAIRPIFLIPIAFRRHFSRGFIQGGPAASQCATRTTQQAILFQRRCAGRGGPIRNALWTPKFADK
jgi:hypothetical protein